MKFLPDLSVLGFDIPSFCPLTLYFPPTPSFLWAEVLCFPCLMGAPPNCPAVVWGLLSAIPNGSGCPSESLPWDVSCASALQQLTAPPTVDLHSCLESSEGLLNPFRLNGSLVAYYPVLGGYIMWQCSIKWQMKLISLVTCMFVLCFVITLLWVN